MSLMLRSAGSSSRLECKSSNGYLKCQTNFPLGSQEQDNQIAQQEHILTNQKSIIEDQERRVRRPCYYMWSILCADRR